jgi:hypothetical protein
MYTNIPKCDTLNITGSILTNNSEIYENTKNKPLQILKKAKEQSYNLMKNITNKLMDLQWVFQ